MKKIDEERFNLQETKNLTLPKIVEYWQNYFL